MNLPKIIERAGERVLTTAQLAAEYETDAITIQQNFHNNKRRYIEGKHFYLVTGDALRTLKRDLEKIEVVIPKNVNRYYLWTERGALLHAKSLNTDKAWQVYDFLVEYYFRKSALPPKLPTAPPKEPLTAEQCKQKHTAALLSELRRKQEALAIAEAELAIARVSASGKRRAVADFIMLNPELMPYANLIEAHE